MAFFLAPRFASAYSAQQCTPWACSPRPARASFPFLGQVDELLGELDRAARREAHRQRQQRKRIARAHFNLHQHRDGYQVDGEIAGFEQEHIEIEVTDDHTLKVSGDTDRKPPAPAPARDTPAIEAPAQDEAMDGVTLSEPARAASPTHSDADSHRSYQATVEDDFEDVSNEFASARSVAPTAAKGKERAADEPTATVETAIAQQPGPQPEPDAAASQSSETDNWRFQGSFERTFRFAERIDASGVRASLKNGLLSIAVPKAKAPEVKRIAIQ